MDGLGVLCYDSVMDQAIPPSHDLPLHLLVRLNRAVAAQQAAAQFLDESLSQFLGLNRQEGRCLELVERLGPLSAARLVAAMGLSVGTVTSIVDRLEAAGYVRRQREANDRHNATVEPTALARDLLARLQERADEMSTPVLESLTPSQIEGIALFLEASGWVGQVRARLLQEHLPANGKPATAERLAAADRVTAAAEQASRMVGVGIRTGAIPSGIPEAEASPPPIPDTANSAA